MSKGDPIRRKFLEHQFAAGMKLANESNLLELLPGPDGSDPPETYIARFKCETALRGEDGQVQTGPAEIHVGIRFPEDYQRRPPEPGEIATLLFPMNIFHPNIVFTGICLGRVYLGMSLVDILYQCFEIFGYENWSSSDHLNPEAARWARAHQDLFPIERRPLKARSASLTVESVNEKETEK